MQPDNIAKNKTKLVPKLAKALKLLIFSIVINKKFFAHKKLNNLTKTGV